MKFSTVKQTALHFVIALCLAGVTRADQTVQSVQQALKDQGFYYGNVTGEKSAETTAAIRRYQIRSALQVTGELNPETLRSLNVSSSASSSRSVSKPVVTQSSSVRSDDSSRLDQNPPPRSLGESSRRAAETNQVPVRTPYDSTPVRMNRRIVAEVKRQLAGRGYYGGKINGRYGHRAASAVRAFQSRSGIVPTGRLDTKTLGALGLSGENMAYLEPATRLNETWVPVTKFKHGKWKVKWKKQHRGDGDEYGDEDEDGNVAGRWHGYGHDDD